MMTEWIRQDWHQIIRFARARLVIFGLLVFSGDDSSIQRLGVVNLVEAASPENIEAAKKAIPKPPLSLHERIDRLIEAKLENERPGQAPAEPATDAEYLRRVWLDLAGMIPTAEAARSFLDDTSPYKRERVIDNLLYRPEYARRMQYVFDS